MTKKEFDAHDREFPAETVEARNRRKREAQDWTNPRDTRTAERAPESDIKHTTERTRKHLTALTKSKSLLLAMSHVCSLKQKIKYSNDVPPNSGRLGPQGMVGREPLHHSWSGG